MHPRRAHSPLSRLAAHEGGATAVEFALLAPVLFLLLAGGIDVARLISQTMQVKAAAQAGAEFALARGWKPTEIAAAVAAATVLDVTATPGPRLAKACVSGQSIIATTATTCAAGGAPGQFVTVSAEAAFKPLMPWPSIGLPQTVDAQAVVRIS